MSLLNKIKLAVLIILLVVVTGGALVGMNPEWTFSTIVAKIEDQYPVPQISTETLAAAMESEEKENYILFDTRLKEEHFTGHIQGSVRVDENMSTEEFMTAYADTIRGKNLVFYCSAGYRSSAFIDRVGEAATEAGAASLANLTGGVFQWFNDGRSVYDREGETDVVHPYGRVWTFLLKDR